MIEEFMHLISNPAHLAFEVATTLVIEGVGALLGWPLVKRLVRRHDRKVHGVPRADGSVRDVQTVAQGIPAARSRPAGPSNATVDAPRRAARVVNVVTWGPNDGGPR